MRLSPLVLTLDAANSVTFNVRFPGQYFDAESGMHYNRHRYYSPELGRYISADPIGQSRAIFQAESMNAEQRLTAAMPFGFSGGLATGYIDLIQTGLLFVDDLTGEWEALPTGGLTRWESNLYAYAASNPVQFYDRLGLDLSAQVKNQAIADATAIRNRGSGPLAQGIKDSLCSTLCADLGFSSGNSSNPGSKDDLDFMTNLKAYCTGTPGVGKPKPSAPSPNNPTGKFNGNRSVNGISHSRGPKAN